MPNPYTRFGYNASDDFEDDVAPEKNYGTKSTGKTKRRNPYTTFGYSDWDQEGTESQKVETTDKNGEKKKKYSQDDEAELRWFGSNESKSDDDFKPGEGKDPRLVQKFKKSDFVGQFDKVDKKTKATIMRQLLANAQAGDENASRMAEWLKEEDRLKGSAMDFVEQSNAKLGGGIGRGFLRGADFLLPGKNTFGMEAKADEWDELDRDEFSAYTERGSQGQKFGTAQKAIADVGTMIIPASKVDKLAKGTQIVKRMKDGSVIVRTAGKAAAILPGSLTATGIDILQEEGRGNDVNIGRSVGIGTGIDLLLPGVGKIAKFADARTGKIIERVLTKGDVEDVSKGLRNIGENGVIGGLNRNVSDAGRRLTYRLSDMMDSTRVGSKIIDMKDSFMTKWVTDMHPLYKTLKRSDFEGRTDGAYLAAREAIGNSNRALSFANDFVDSNENMHKVVNGIQEKHGVDVIKGKKEFDEFAKIKSELDLHAAGKKEFTPEKVKELTDRLGKLKTTYDDEYQGLVDFYKDLNDFRLENGLISQEQYDEFADAGFDYVRQQRELPQWMLDKPATAGRGSRASITKSGAIQKRNKYASAELLSPLETAVKTAQLAHVEAYRNKAAKTVYGLLDEAGEAKLVRSTDIVRDKQALLADLKQTKPIASKMNRTLRAQQKQVRALQSELDRLNKEGMDFRLKQGAPKVKRHSIDDITPGTDVAGVDVDPVRVKEYEDILDNGGKLDPVVVKYVNGKPYLQDGQNRLAAYRNKGITRVPTVEESAYRASLPEFQPAGLGGQVPTSKAGQTIPRTAEENSIMRELGYKNDELPTWASKLGPKDTRAFLNNLVTEDPAEIRRIRKMIEGRNTKLEPLLDQVELMSRDLDDLYKQRSDVWNTANSMKTTVDKGGMTSLSFLDDGVENVVKVDPVVASAIHNWDAQKQNVMNEVLRFSNNVFKYGTTGANVGFALPNFVADQMGSAINSKRMLSTHNPVNFVRSLFMTLGKPLNAEDDKILKSYLAANKGQLTINQYTKKAAADKVSSNMVRKGSGTGSQIYTMIRHPKEGMRTLFDGLEGGVGITENLTRVQNYRGTYKRAVKEGLDDAGRIANQAARENSVDFLEMGNYGRMANSFIPYFNAAIQGNRVMLRNLAERPVSFVAKTTALVGMPVAASTIWNVSDERRKGIYDTIPEYVKETNFVIIRPDAKWNEDKKKWDGVILLKKPPGFKEFTEPVRKYIEYANDNDPDKKQGLLGFLQEEGGDLAADFGSTITPIDFSDENKFLSSVTPQLLKPTAEAITNRNFFQGENIVPDSFKDMDPADQRYKNYSELTSHLAGLFNTSPLKVDNWIKGTFGEVGTNAQHYTDRLVFGGSKNNIDPATGETFSNVGGRSLPETVTRRFAGAPGGADTEAFYNTYNPASAARKRVSKEVTALVRAGKINQAKRVAKEYNESIESRFEDFNRRFKDSPNYDPEWDDRVKELRIPITSRGFKARARQDDDEE